MPPQIAAIAYVMLILGLFLLSRDKSKHTSPWLWLAVIWLLLASSRSVTQWLSLGQPIYSTDQLLEGSPIDRAVYTGLLVVGLLVLATRGRRIRELLSQNIPIVSFFLYCAVSLLWSDYSDVGLKRWIKAIGDFVMVSIVMTDQEPASAVDRMLTRAGYLLIPVSVLLIKYYPEYGKTYGQWDYKAYYTGVTTNKNTLGALCLLFGIGFLWRFVNAYQDPKGSSRNRDLVASGVILGMIGWLFSIVNSMTSLACFVLAGGLLLAATLRPSIRNPRALHICVGAAIGFAAFSLFVAPALLNTIGRDSTLTDRTGIWDLALSLSQNGFVGTGFESFWLGPRLTAMSAVFHWHPNEAHNGYLETFLNLGWVGLALLGFVLLRGYRTVLASLRRNPRIGTLMLAYFTAGIIYNFTEAAFFRMMAPVWIFFLLAITRSPQLLCSESTIAVEPRLKPVPHWDYLPSGARSS